MSAHLQPEIQAYLAGGIIAKGKVVKKGSDDKHVAVCSAATDKMVGLMQNASSAAEDVVEVAVSGGAKGLAGGTIAMGDLLTANSDGELIATTTEDDRVIGIAMQDAVDGDIFAVKISQGIV